jgi:hypothetical protein
LRTKANRQKSGCTRVGVHENLRDVAVQILGIITKQYQNAAVKHDNTVAGGAEKTWADFEVEYVLYQYAVLIRLLIEVAELPQAAAGRRAAVRWPGAEAPRSSRAARRHGGCRSLLPVVRLVAAAAALLRLRHLKAARG